MTISRETNHQAIRAECQHCAETIESRIDLGAGEICIIVERHRCFDDRDEPSSSGG